MKIAILVPHVFMDEKYLNDVIFSPGTIAIDLAEGLADEGNDVTLFSPGKIRNSKFKNINADTSLIDHELKIRGYDLSELMNKHPLTYITLARQIQSELISKAYKMANDGKFDIVHVWITEEDIALEFAKLCNKPVVFTHHEPFNFYTKYRTSFAKYKDLNWISISYAQRKTINEKMNWIANIYHGIKDPFFEFKIEKSREYKKYFAYCGRIIEPKGVHLAIKAVIKYNEELKNKDTKKYTPTPLLIAGKHYSDTAKDSYWEKQIKPYIDNKVIKYVGFIKNPEEKFNFLYNARALLAPSTWEEPFGLMTIEAMAVGTPTVVLANGALKEVVKNNINGILIENEKNEKNESKIIKNISEALLSVNKIDSEIVRDEFLKNYNVKKMVEQYLGIYKNYTITKIEV